MNDNKRKDKVNPQEGMEKAPYESPAIIYEGLITTRAASSSGRDDEAIDPADIFGDND